MASLRVVRTSNCTPMSASSRVTALATADTDTPSWVAAAVKLPLSATRTKAIIERSLFMP